MALDAAQQPAEREFGELLTDAEIEHMTRKDRPTAQARALKRMGLPCRLENGVVLASRHHLREWLKDGSAKGDDGFNWSAAA